MSQEERKVDLSNIPRGAIGLRGLPVNRNARLPSIRTPRDLTLGSQPKRTFTPNIPQRREKKTPEVTPSNSSNTPDGFRSSRDSKKNEKTRGRGRGRGNFIQMEGSIFGEGVHAGTPSHKDRIRESASYGGGSSRSSLATKKEKMEAGEVHRDLDGVLFRDDFIDDGDEENDGVKPVIFPTPVLTHKKEEAAATESEMQDAFKNPDLAKEMGFNVENISKLIKKEKEDTKTPAIKSMKLDHLPPCDVSNLFAKDESQLLLLQFPKCITTPQIIEENSKGQSSREGSPQNEINKSSVSLSALPEGRIGKLQILKSGRARIVLGGLTFDLDAIKPLLSKHEAVTIQTSSDSGDVTVLGNLMHKLSFAPDIMDVVR